MTTRHLIACKECHRQYDVTGMKPGDRLRCRCGFLLEVPQIPAAHEARILHCSGCGGKLPADATRCPYCGGSVSLEDRQLGPACPECFARLRVGARFCSACGVRIDPEKIRTVPAEARCPRCEGELVEREAGGKEYLECTSCGGIWVDAEFFEKCIRERDLKALAAFGKGEGTGPGGPSGPGSRSADLEKVRYIPCPVCGQLMNRKNFAGCSGVIIDWCGRHGFWFDAEELEKILRFVQSGGLDKARERELRRSQEEIIRLESQVRSWGGTPRAPLWGFRPPAPRPATDWLGELGSALDALFRGLLP